MKKLSDHIITDKKFYICALTIIIPIALQQIINQGVTLMDTIMVGSLGEVAISATDLANQFYNIFNFLVMGLSAAGIVLSSQYWGAGDKVSVSRIFDFLIQLVVLFAVIFGIISFFMPGRIMGMYTKDAEIIHEGIRYLRVIAFVYVLHGFALLLANIIRSIGNASLGFYVACVSFLVNITANYIFIFGKLGLPAMGVQGAALGTLCARFVEFVVTAYYLLKKEKVLRYRFNGVFHLPQKLLLSEFRRLGVPAIISDTLLAVSASIIGMILGHMGKEYVSAYSIVNVVDRMCTVASLGVSMAAAVIVGQTVGAGKKEHAKKQGLSFLFIGAGFGTLGAILILSVGEWSIGLYNITPETFEITRKMMVASAFIIVFQNTASTLGKGVLRGGGDTRFLLYGDVIFQWLVSIPLGYLLGLKLNLSPYIVFAAIKFDNVIKAIWFTFRIRTDKWIVNAKSTH